MLALRDQGHSLMGLDHVDTMLALAFAPIGHEFVWTAVVIFRNALHEVATQFFPFLPSFDFESMHIEFSSTSVIAIVRTFRASERDC